MKLAQILLITIVFVSGSFSASSVLAEEVKVETARAALRRGVEYFRTEVSIEGGYLWRYAADFSEREGEVPASATTAWVQPPGTPSVGQAYLAVYELTGDDYYLEAARETALALVRGQLKSGGWDYRIEFAPADRAKFAYRSGGGAPVEDQPIETEDKSEENKPAKKKRPPRNTTTLDDNTTQAALRFLMLVDRALEFQDQAIHEAVEYSLQSLIDAQYPNGAWPQRFSEPPDPEQHPVKPANYPADWPREHPKRDYRAYYTFNDNTMSDMIDVMFMAAETYEEPKYEAAAARAGGFLLLAQMPEPQPGWAQQYNTEMQPAWARRFEPPAITGAESQGVMRMLLRLYQRTGDQKYLEPLPQALAYYRNSLLPDGRLARFYELQTNKPLYFTKEYELTYDDSDLPTHYGFKTSSKLDGIEKTFRQYLRNGPGEPQIHRLLRQQRPPRLNAGLQKRTAKVVATQAENGSWIELAPERSRSKIPAKTPCLNCGTFIRNIELLAEYIAAAEGR